MTWVLSCNSYDKVIKHAKNTTYSLDAGLIRKDFQLKKNVRYYVAWCPYILVTLALQIGDQFEVGSVWVNRYHAIQFQASFGGFKQPGLEEYYEVKTVSTKLY